MKLTMHKYRGEDDYWRIREFLRQVFVLNGRRELSWHVAQLDYWRWHLVRNCWEGGGVGDFTYLWETPEGQIAAVMNPEDKREAHLHMHPGLRTAELEGEMLDVAEKRLSLSDPSKERKLRVWADARDDLRQDILIRRGYVKGDYPGHQRRRLLSAPILDAPAPEGYTLRALGDVQELPARSWASWRAFHPDSPDEDYLGWDWYQNVQYAPLYRRDLDVMAVAPNGDVASFCTVWYDDVTRSAYFEPVGTAPEHQRRGLGKAVMCQGLRRLKQMGATLAFVSSYEPPAHALYASVGFTEYDLSEPWIKEF